MIAYNRTWLENLELVKKSKQWFARGLLTGEQARAVTERYRHDFYSPPYYIKIGLFVFTFLAVSFTGLFYSLLFLVASHAIDHKGAVIFSCLLFAVLCLGALEFFIKDRNIFRSGIDEALLYMAVCLLHAAALLILHDSESSGLQLRYSLASLPILALAVIRYADRLAALALVSCLYSIVFLILAETGEAAKIILPPAMMALSACLYWLALKTKQREGLLPWTGCIMVFEYFFLTAFYISCNYYVIRESGILFFGLAPEKGVPLGAVFFILTAVVPLLYIFFGLRRKDGILLRSGLVAAAAAALTFKYYFSLGRPEIALTVAGVLMIALAAAAIKYFRKPRFGITFEKETDGDRSLESFIGQLAESKIGDAGERIPR